MNIDLEGELSRLAQSVHDDGATDRMSGQVRHMVGRIKRRRAARHTAQGAVGIGAAAAVAFGGVQLAGRPDVTPPAETPSPTSSPTPTATAADFGRCGSAVIPPNGGADPGVEFDAEVDGVEVSGPDAVSLTGSLTGSIDVLEAEQVMRTVVALDGVVVGNLGELASQRLDGDRTLYSFDQPLVSCEDGTTRLPAGDYELYAHLDGLTEGGEGVTEALFGPWMITVAPDGDEAGNENVTSEEHDALVTLNEMVSFPAENPDGIFPMCGTDSYAALDDGMPVIELDLDEPELSLPAGDTYEGTVQLRTTEGHYAIANASPVATLVILRDSVVVGYQWLDPEGLEDVDLADGETQEFPVLGTMNFCGTGEGGTGSLQALPPGEYRIMAALDLMVKETGRPGEEPDGTTYPFTAVSEAGYLTITRP